MEPNYHMVENYCVSEDMVRDFTERFLQPCPTTPTLLTEDALKLRERLVLEELGEVLEAFRLGNLDQAFKELCDLQYVVDQFFVTAGLDRVKESGVMLVHRSNMSKLGLDGKPILREDGKILKGPNYESVHPQELAALIDAALIEWK